MNTSDSKDKLNGIFLLFWIQHTILKKMYHSFHKNINMQKKQFLALNHLDILHLTLFPIEESKNKKTWI